MEFDGHVLLGLVNCKPLFGILRRESFLPLLRSMTHCCDSHKAPSSRIRASHQQVRRQNCVTKTRIAPDYRSSYIVVGGCVDNDEDGDGDEAKPLF